MRRCRGTWRSPRPFSPAAAAMLHQAFRTRELSSYSIGNIALANVGGAVHSAYVFQLPPGPIRSLHMFYMVSPALVLYWYRRCRAVRPGRPIAATRVVSMAAVARKAER